MTMLPEWEGKDVRSKFEEDTFFDSKVVTYMRLGKMGLILINPTKES
ncbi:MAG: hypothetical protein ACI9GW_003212 [Halieaceae bacterium]|jgi:hypothetical protein